MLTEPLPVEFFIERLFHDVRILKITEGWRVENDDIRAIVVAHFKEMGFYTAPPQMEKYFRSQIIFFLQNSPEILQLVHRMAVLEESRKSSRNDGE